MQKRVAGNGSDAPKNKDVIEILLDAKLK